MNELDITHFKTTNKQALMDAIEEAVRIHQSGPMIIPLPDELLMTKKQYNILRNDMLPGYAPPLLEGTQMKKVNETLYYTSRCIMECRIK